MLFVLMRFSAMADIAIPGMAVRYRAFLSCVSRKSTGLSKHGVGAQPLFCLDFRDCDRACTRGRGVMLSVPGPSPQIFNVTLDLHHTTPSNMRPVPHACVPQAHMIAVSASSILSLGFSRGKQDVEPPGSSSDHSLIAGSQSFRESQSFPGCVPTGLVLSPYGLGSRFGEYSDDEEDCGTEYSSGSDSLGNLSWHLTQHLRERTTPRIKISKDLMALLDSSEQEISSHQLAVMQVCR